MLALAGIRRLVVQIKAIGKADWSGRQGEDQKVTELLSLFSKSSVDLAEDEFSDLVRANKKHFKTL
jgi:hypothetical protein